MANRTYSFLIGYISETSLCDCWDMVRATDAFEAVAVFQSASYNRKAYRLHTIRQLGN
jgi:hypothetical protein